MVDFDSLVDDSQKDAAPAAEPSALEKFVLPQTPSKTPPQAVEHQDFDSLVSDEDKYNTAGQQAAAFVEGVGRGATGPLTTALETGGKDVTGPFKPLLEHFPGLGVDPEGIRGRAETGAHTAGEVAGFVGSALLGTGEAAAMSELGNAATKAIGFGEATKLARIGSSAAQQAVEMAIMATGDEASKRLINDPKATAESSLTNIGLATALGGGAGAFITGAASPLWKATVGPKAEALLTRLHTSINGGAVLPEAVQKAAGELQITPEPVIQAALSGNPRALELARNLYRNQNTDFLASLKKFETDASKSVASKMGVPLEDTLVFSNKEAGDELARTAKDVINAKYAPRAAEQQAKQAERLHMNVSEDDVIQFASNLHQMGTDEMISSEFRKMYEKVAGDLLEKKTVGGIDSLKSELGSKMRRAEGTERMHLGRMMNEIDQFAEDQVTKLSTEVAGKEGAQLGEKAIVDAAEARANYKKFADEMRGLQEYLGIGDFTGTGTLLSKLDNITAETLIKKFSTKGDVEGAAFLNKTFPELAEKVRQHEVKQFLSKSVKQEGTEVVLNTKGLNKRIAELRKGSPEYVDYIMPKEGAAAVDNAQQIHDAISHITDMKDSGTPAGIGKLFKHMGSGVAGAVAYLSGHGVIGTGVAAVVGNAIHAAPDYVRTALLKFMASGAPVKAEGFKAMVDYIAHNAKAEKAMNAAVDGVFKTGARPNIYIPPQTTLMKLDKLVANNEKNPEATAAKLANSDIGHYLPEHQATLTQTTVTALNYLQSIKPRPTVLGPLDRPIEPTAEQQHRYERALTIAENPNIIFKHIADGTLQVNDIKDIGNMYPALYQQMVTKLTNQMANVKSDDEPVPYKTRIGLSLFMGQPMDSTMTPQAIQAAQPAPKPAPQQGKAASGSTTKLGKHNSSYKTPSQEAESDRSSRD